tara:strand:+ start:8415 stop:10367 length:1953 start_codon:yes stop_codon:yes gene_type:complete
MAGAVIEVKYFNTFLLKKVNTSSNQVVWNGSRGIPENIGGYPAIPGLNDDETWVIEESRIRGGYNNTTVDFGAKAYLVEEEPNGTRRFNTLIYSGIFNSRTGINNTNVFSVADDITKSADPANGSIQKLYAEDTNLNIFQELKCSRALIDKDAIFTAEGNPAVTASNLVIGVIQPINGKYGISKNPESFATYGNRKYFSDENNNVVLRLAGGGIEEISSYGMKDFFRDEINKINSAGSLGKILGSYDIYGSEYVISLQSPSRYREATTRTSGSLYNTLNFDERAQGWVSFFDYAPDQMFSLRNNFYSVKSNAGSATVVTSATGFTFNINNIVGFIQQYSIVTGTGITAGTTVSSFTPDSNDPTKGSITITPGATLSAGDTLSFTAVPQLWRHYDASVNRGNFYGANYPSSITFVFNPNPTNSKTFKTVGYEGSNGWQVDTFSSDSTGARLSVDGLGYNSSEDTTDRIISGFDSISTLSYNDGEYVLTEGKASVAINTTSANVVLNLSTFTGYVNAGDVVTSSSLQSQRTVVSYNNATGALVLNQSGTLNAGDVLHFSGVVNRSNYLSVFNTVNPPLSKYYSGFNRKENKYVANLLNFSNPNSAEVLYGQNISGIKGFYATVKMSTDKTTDFGGEKTLFSVESTYDMNNGY